MITSIFCKVVSLAHLFLGTYAFSPKEQPAILHVFHLSLKLRRLSKSLTMRTKAVEDFSEETLASHDFALVAPLAFQ